jgi:CheY-like chemotaxis protein
LTYLSKRLAGDTDFELVGPMMQRQAAHLARLVDDLMDVSRITRGKFELRKARVVLVEAVGRAAEAARPILEERQHRLEVHLPSEPLTLEADPDRLEQVLANLLTNAAKYTPPGGLVTLTAQREDSDAVVCVRDNGIGIRPEMLPRLFDMFQQADHVPGRLSEGLGLGLTLVRSLVEMHGGNVQARSEGPGKGSEFVVRLPTLNCGEAADPSALPERGKVRSLRILVTDDNVDSAASMAMLLSLYGHDVRIAHDGLQGLEEARRFHPQVAFLDIGLPRGMDGYELARRLRQEPGLGEAVLVAMTGYAQPEDLARARGAGFDHHLTKPAPPDVVQNLLAAVQPST